MKRSSIRNPLCYADYMSELVFLEQNLLNSNFSMKTIQGLVNIYTVF